MNIIDPKKSLSEQYRSIDFDNFELGDTYVLVYRGQFLLAKVGHFRKGIAIAHNNEGDYLINTACEILYDGRQYTYRISKKQIQRSLNGFKIMWEEDVSAPGKDDYWQPRYSFISEISVASEHKIRSSYVGYNVPYERGKIIKFGNSFYDFETYDYLFAIPDNVDSFVNDACRLYDSYDNDGRVYDEEVCFDLKNISSNRNINEEESNKWSRAISSLYVINERPKFKIFENDLSKYCIDVFNLFSAEKYVERLFSSDKKILNSKLDLCFNIFNEFPELRKAFDIGFKQHAEIMSQYGIDSIGKIDSSNSSYGSLRIQFIQSECNFFVINYESELDSSKKYVFNSNGDLLSVNGYDNICIIKQGRFCKLMFKRGEDLGIMTINHFGQANKDVTISENRYDLTYPCKRKNIVCKKYDLDYKNNRIILVADLEILRQSALSGHWQWDGMGHTIMFSELVFYINIYHVLESEAFDRAKWIQPVINGYLYKL